MLEAVAWMIWGYRVPPPILGHLHMRVPLEKQTSSSSQYQPVEISKEAETQSICRRKTHSLLPGTRIRFMWLGTWTLRTYYSWLCEIDGHYGVTNWCIPEITVGPRLAVATLGTPASLLTFSLVKRIPANLCSFWPFFLNLATPCCWNPHCRQNLRCSH